MQEHVERSRDPDISRLSLYLNSLAELVVLGERDLVEIVNPHCLNFDVEVERVELSCHYGCLKLAHGYYPGSQLLGLVAEGH